MSKVDWSQAPEGAEFYACGAFRRLNGTICPSRFDDSDWRSGAHTMDDLMTYKDYQPRPQQWPETDERIDNIGRNRTYDDLGHYNAPERATSDEKQKEVSMSHYDKQREQEEAKRIMEQREKQEASRVALTHKYERLIIGKRKSGNCVIDVYRVIDAYGIQCPAIAHALKKLLCTGTRGHKDYAQDLVEAIKSIEEALALFVDKNSSDHTQPKTAP